MATRTREDRRLRLLSAVCLALPETERTNCGAHADFRVNGRIFAYFLKNHGGDGITAACFKSRLGQHVEQVKQAPDRFYLPQYLGRRGWFGLRLDLDAIDWDEIAALAEVSYNVVTQKAPRKSPITSGNALTSRSLVRGAPIVDGSTLNGEPLVEDLGDPRRTLQPTDLPHTAIIRQSSGLRRRS